MTDPGIDSIAVLQERTYSYFARACNPENGLIQDSTRPDAAASIAGSGMALGCLVAAADRGLEARPAAAARARTILEFLMSAEQSDRPTAAGYKGFFYHFLDMQSGRRTRASELSTIDSAILFAGALVAAEYFDSSSADERAIRELGHALYERAEWRWMLRNGAVSHGWRPESGFLRYDWRGYNEALFLMILALGSPRHAIPRESYREWLSTYRWRKIYGHEYLYAGPLFTHQLSHLWIDFRGIHDSYMKERCIDYFENSRRATYVQRAYASHNPRGFKGYGENAWGVTASDGPATDAEPTTRRGRRFLGYHARGVPFGPDDGTLSPWAIVASLPFAPEIVVPAMRHLDATYPDINNHYGYESSFNPSYPERTATGWISRWHYAIDQGPLVLMVDNYLSGLMWRMTRKCEYIVRGLKRAGFSGGWLEQP
ncbi:MAG: glucoamylase family protein [Gemmatimonadaceae bacterium]